MLTEVFDAVYRGESVFGPQPPWDIGRAQPAFVALEHAGLVRGRVLDPGCGTGEDVLYLASQSYEATGLDLAPTAIAVARKKATDRGIRASFEVGNAQELVGYEGHFDTVIDSGLAHSFDPDGLDRYAAALHRACRPGAVVHILEASNQGAEQMQARLGEVVEGLPSQLPDNAPRRSIDDIGASFTDGWQVESVGETKMLAVLPTTSEPFSIHAWLARVRRN